MALLEIFLAFVFPILNYGISSYKHVKFWNKERQSFLWKSSVICVISSIGVVLVVLGFVGLIIVMTFDSVTLLEELSPLENKLFFGGMFGLFLLFGGYMSLGFAVGSGKILIKTIRGEEYKHYGGIA